MLNKERLTKTVPIIRSSMIRRTQIDEYALRSAQDAAEALRHMLLKAGFVKGAGVEVEEDTWNRKKTYSQTINYPHGDLIPMFQYIASRRDEYDASRSLFESLDSMSGPISQSVYSKSQAVRKALYEKNKTAGVKVSPELKAKLEDFFSLF
jgi:hypothetical protein